MSSKEHAEDRLEKWQKAFYWAEFSNVKIYRETRYRTQEIDMVLAQKAEENIDKPSKTETADDLAKVSKTFAKEMKLKKSKKKKK